MGKKHPNDSFRSGTAAGSSERGDPDHSPREQDAGAPTPSALLPTLDERQLSVLRRIGRVWGRVCDDPEVWREALPVDPALGSFPDPTKIQPTRFGRFVRVSLRTGGTASCTIRPPRDCDVLSDLCRRSSSRPSRSTCQARRRSTNEIELNSSRSPLSLGTCKFFASCTSNGWACPSHLRAKIPRTPVHSDGEATLATTLEWELK